MRYFNTSGPNIISQHYTLMRPQLVAEGLKKIQGDRYFTIWAPRQTGKSTYFRLLASRLEQEGYDVAYVNFETDAVGDRGLRRAVFLPMKLTLGAILAQVVPLAVQLRLRIGIVKRGAEEHIGSVVKLPVPVSVQRLFIDATG